MPLLSELPADPAKRDAVLDAASTTAGPEQRQGMTKKERKAETAAATAAAILGGLFSKTKSVTIGAATQLDEDELIAPQAVPRVRPASAAKDDGAAKPGAPPVDDREGPNTDLLPWIKLK
jgi:predicted exporter